MEVEHVETEQFHALELVGQGTDTLATRLNIRRSNVDKVGRMGHAHGGGEVRRFERLLEVPRRFRIVGLCPPLPLIAGE